MEYIQRRTNVRRHERQTKHKVANIRMHERNLKSRKMLGVIPLKSLTYPRAKAIFPTLEPYGDIDEDRVINKRDCRPFDTNKQDEEYDWEMDSAERERMRQKEWLEEREKIKLEKQDEEERQKIREELEKQKEKHRRGWEREL